MTFYITREKLAYHSNHGEYFFEVEFTTRLDLVNLMYYRNRINTEKTIEELDKNRSIDGFISNQFQEPYDIEIKLTNCENYIIREIEEPERIDIKKQEEINILTDNMLSSYRLK